MRFLVNVPLPETPEDWIPSKYVSRPLPKAQIRPFVRYALERTIAKGSTAITRESIETVVSDPDEKLLESAKQVFVDFHRAGALIPMLQARQRQVSPESLSE